MPLRAKPLQIAWHADEKGRNQPIHGLDLHPSLPLLATGSIEKVHIWRVRSDPPAAGLDAGAATGSSAEVAPALPAAHPSDVNVEFLFALTHARTVNAVRFSPNGTWPKWG